MLIFIVNFQFTFTPSLLACSTAAAKDLLLSDELMIAVLHNKVGYN